MCKVKRPVEWKTKSNLEQSIQNILADRHGSNRSHVVLFYAQVLLPQFPEFRWVLRVCPLQIRLNFLHVPMSAMILPVALA